MEVVKGSISHTIAADTTVKVRCDVTDVARLATSPENLKFKKRKKSTIQVKIMSKNKKYTSTMRTRTYIKKRRGPHIDARRVDTERREE